MKDEGSRVRPVASPRDQEAIMRRFRFSIASLLGVVLFISVALAALRASTDVWDGCLLGLDLAVLLTAILLVVHRTDRKRAYWLGFALFGWTYLIVSLIPPIGLRLPTTKGLTFIDSKIPGRHRAWATAVLTYTNTASTNPVHSVAFSPQGDSLASSSQGIIRVWDVKTGKLLTGPFATTENFIRIGHSLLALVLAFLGGHLSRHLYGQRREDGSNPPIDSPASP
jgi:WD domain, G-beta repeat